MTKTSNDTVLIRSSSRSAARVGTEPEQGASASPVTPIHHRSAYLPAILCTVGIGALPASLRLVGIEPDNAKRANQREMATLGIVLGQEILHIRYTPYRNLLRVKMRANMGLASVVSGFVLALVFVCPQRAEANDGEPASHDGDIVIANERAAWAAGKALDKVAWATLLAPEYSQIGPDGLLVSRKQVLETFGSEVLKDYSLTDIKSTELGGRVVLLTYSFHIRSTTEGTPFEGTFGASSLWEKRGEKWLCAFYQETPVP